MIRKFSYLGPLVVALALAGVGPAFAQALTPAEVGPLLAKYNRWAASVRSLRGGGDVRLGAEGEKERGFKFSLAMDGAPRVRMQGRLGNIATLFDLAADDSTWTLLLPRQLQVVRSGDPRASVGLLMPPRDLVRALLPMGIPTADFHRDGAASRSGRWTRLVVPPGHGGAGSPFHRVLYVDGLGIPRRLEIRRESQLEPVLLQVRFSEYDDKTVTFPRRVHIDLGQGEPWADLTFSSVKLNEDLDDRRFRILVPHHAEEIALEDIDQGFLPEAKE